MPKVVKVTSDYRSAMQIDTTALFPFSSSYFPSTEALQADFAYL